MARDYKFNFSIPGGTCKASASSPDELAMLLPAGIVNGLQPKEQQESPCLESVARDALELLRSHMLEVRGRVGHTVLSRAGLELDLIKCYLQGMTIGESVNWLENNCAFEGSKSAVGRYWKYLREIQIVPANELIPGQL